MYIEDQSSVSFKEWRKYDLETGVSMSIDGSTPYNDPVVNAQTTVDNAAAVIGRIVSVLASKGLLDRDDVQFLVGSTPRFVVVGEGSDDPAG